MIFNCIKERLYHGIPVFSFEFFPPKTEKGEEELYQTIAELAKMNPDFVSVTYGAGGSTRDKTRNIVYEIKNRFGLEVMPHLTCVGHTNEEIESMLREYAANNITNVLALRGDAPRGVENWEPVAGGPEHASEVVEIAHKAGQFSVGVAGFPEKHPESKDIEQDICFLKKKVDCGADFVITQLFFDNDIFFDYVAHARRHGVTVPILPGVMPITRYGQIEKFRELSGCYIPPPYLMPIKNGHWMCR